MDGKELLIIAIKKRMQQASLAQVRIMYQVAKYVCPFIGPKAEETK